MQFEALPESDHPAVALRPITAHDVPNWLAYLVRPEVYEQTSWNRPSLDDLGRYVWSEEQRAPDRAVRFAIVMRSSDTLVGTIGFHSILPQDRVAELAYDLAPQAWGQGIATHLVQLLVNWAHWHAKIVRVQATVLESNERSAKVLERAGFEREGLLRAYRVVRGTPQDFYMFSHVRTNT